MICKECRRVIITAIYSSIATRQTEFVDESKTTLGGNANAENHDQRHGNLEAKGEKVKDFVCKSAH